MEFNEALAAQQQVVRLQALLEASRQIHSTIEMDEVLRIVLQIVVRELELTGAFFTNFVHTYGHVEPHVQASLTSDSSECAGQFDQQRWLRFPLFDKAGQGLTDLVVLLCLDRELELDETDFLESIAVQAGVAIENARFHERTLEWQRVASDLASARQVQMSLIPQTMPVIPHYAVAARSVTCYEVGGDYLDIVEMPTGEVVLVVGDVAGKGLTSALVGTSFRSALRAMVHANLSLCEIATQMNLLHYGEGAESRRRYVTAMLMRLDPKTDVLEVINAGHNPGFLRTAEGTLTTIVASGTPIGILPYSSYVPENFVLGSGARLLVYTDGMTEVFCAEEEFGEGRLLQTFLSCDEATPEGALDRLWRTLEEFSCGSEQSDDMTALILFRTS